MKAVLLYFSLTGNTEYVAKQLGAALVKRGHIPMYINLVPVIRAMNLLVRDREASKVPMATKTEKEYLALVDAIKDSEILALGSLVDGGICAPGVAEVFAPDVLPSELFSSVKYIITFSTYGSVENSTGDILATLALSRKPAAIFAGQVNIRVPENWIPLLPDKPYIDAWDPKRIEVMQKTIEEICDFVSQPYDDQHPPTSRPFNKIPVDPSLYLHVHKYSGELYVQREKCIKCGICFRGCPYHAITMSQDIEDGYPVFHPEWCYICGLCFNKCPKEAVQMRCPHSEQRQRYRSTTAELTAEKAAKMGVIPRVIPELPDLFPRRE